MIYTIIPAVFVILQFVPILFYDMVGEKKERITAALAERRSAQESENDTAETDEIIEDIAE
jgi:Na+/melibiose symporter-like transporter